MILPQTAHTLEQCPVIHGNVYGLAWAAGDMPQATEAPPNEPVLFFKTKNTYLSDGADVVLPTSVPTVDASAVVGLVFGQEVRCVRAKDALAHVCGYILAIDVSESGAEILRPPVREKCRDGFLPLATKVASAETLPLDSISLGMRVNGQMIGEANLHGQAASMATVIEAASRFMTFREGDVLLSSLRITAHCVDAESVIEAVSTALGHVTCRTVREVEGTR